MILQYDKGLLGPTTLKPIKKLWIFFFQVFGITLTYFFILYQFHSTEKSVIPKN